MTPFLSLRNILRKNSLACSDADVEKLVRYAELLAEWNSKINLVSRRDQENILERHIVHSLSLLFSFDFDEGASVLDLGTGGGLPGIPLSIVRPRNQFTLVDSIQKKMNAVADMTRKLELPNVNLLTGRAEEIAKNFSTQHSFPYIVTRAVASITEIVRWSKPLLMKGEDSFPETTLHARSVIPRGSIIMYKGGDLTQEVREAELKVKPKKLTIHPLVVLGIDPELTQEKKLVIINP